MEGKLVFGMLLMLLVVGMVSAMGMNSGKWLKGEDTACKVMGRAGKIMCHKVLRGECDDDDMSGSHEDTTGDSQSMEDSSESPEDSTGGSMESAEGSTPPMSNNNDDDDDDDNDDEECRKTKPLQIWVVSIQEMANGTEVGDAVSLDNEDFTFATAEPAEDTTIPDTNDVKSSSIQLMASLANGGTFSVHVYVVKGDGKVTLDDEEGEIKKGQLKFSITVAEWEWTTGDSLDVTMQYSGRGSPSAKDQTGSKRPKKVELEGNMEIDLSGKMKIGGEWKDMAEGYPMVESRGNRNLITVRLEKPMGADTTMYYDPVAEMGDWPEDGDGPISAAVTSYVSFAFMTSLMAAIFVL